LAAIGREKNSYGDDRYQGKISDIIVYDTALPSVEVLSVEQYLYATWNLP
jgi:hypothetical protein